MASYFPMVKNSAQRIVFPILDADGDPVTGAAADTPDSEYSLDGATFVDCSDEIHEIATASGVYYLDLLAGETNGDVVCIQVKTATAGTKTTVLVFYTAAQSLNTMDTNIDDIETDTAVIGALGAGLTAIPWNAAWDAEVQSECADALAVYDPPTKAEMDTGHGLLATAAVCTEARLAELAAANLPTDIAAVKTDTAAILLDTGTDGVVVPQAQADKVWGTAARALTDKVGFALSTAGILAIWHQLTANIVTASTIGKLLVDNVNATISSRSSHAAADVWAVATRTLSSFGTLVADIWGYATRVLTANTNLNDPTAAAIADAVFDEAKAGHVAAGSFGEEIQAHATPAEVATELGTYDAPTKAEMDTAHALLATPAQVNTEVDSALNTAIPVTPTADSVNERIKTLDDHDLVTKIPGIVTAVGPTKAEMDTAHALLATAAVCTEARLAELAAANLPADIDTLKTYCDILDHATNGLAAIKAEVEGLAGAAMRGTDSAALASAWTAALATALGNYTAARAGYLDNLSAGAVALEATLTTMKQKIAGAFDRETDSLEALRDRGDAAWVTGAGGDATEAKQDTIIGYLDTEIAAILAAVDTEVAAIKAKTDGLPSDPADDSDIDTQLAANKVILDKLDSAMEADGAVHRFTENALEQAPAGVGAAPTVEEIDTQLTESHGEGSWLTGEVGGGWAVLEGWSAEDRGKVLKQLNEILTILKKKLDTDIYEEGLTILVSGLTKLLKSAQTGGSLSEKRIETSIGELMDQIDELRKVGKMSASKEDITTLRESLSSLLSRDDGRKNLEQKILGIVSKLEELKESFKTNLEEVVAPLLPDETLERMVDDAEER